MALKGFSAGGRPTKYTPEMLADALDYVENYNTKFNDVVPSVVGLCRAIGVGKTAVYDWCKDPSKSQFADIVNAINEFQENDLVNESLAGRINPQISKMMLAKHGYSDRVEQDITSSDGSMTPVHPGYTIVDSDD